MSEELVGEKKHIFRGGVALLFAVLIDSFGVVLMLYLRSGISAISSVPYAFSEMFFRSLPWDLNLYFLGDARVESDDFAKTVCVSVSIQFRSGFVFGG